MADWYVSSAAWTAIAQFAASTAYTVGQVVRPLTAPAFGAQYAFRCTTAGTSATEPGWSGAPSNGNTVSSGGATFTNVSGQSAYGWSAAAGNTIALSPAGAGLNRYAIGDRIFLSSDHSESSTNNLTLPPSGFGLFQVLSVNRAGSVPPVAADQLAGATFIYNGSGGFIIDAPCNSYWQGITFNLGASGNGISLANTGTKSHYFRNCAFVFSTSNTTANFSNGNWIKAILDNTTVQFNNVGQRFTGSSYAFDLMWLNTPSAVLGTAPTTLFAGGGNVPFIISCRGVDLSAVTSNLAYSSGAASFIKVLLDSCRIASGVTRLGTGSYNTAADEIELVNCFDGTSILSERHTPAGDITTNRSTTLVGGAQDDVGLFSHQLVSSVRADMLAMTLDSFWMDVENTYTGAARTATVEIISSGTLNNTDISLVLEYMGTSGSSLGTLTSTLPSALTTSTALATSIATWNSPPATPVAQHIQATFTPQTAGRVRGVVRLGKPSTTVYVNPQIIVS